MPRGLPGLDPGSRTTLLCTSVLILIRFIDRNLSGCYNKHDCELEGWISRRVIDYIKATTLIFPAYIASNYANPPDEKNEEIAVSWLPMN